MPTLLAPFLHALTVATAPSPDRVADWTEDVLHLVGEIERSHPEPFFGTPREEFEAAVDELVGRLESLSDDAVVVEIMRLVALLARQGRDGHSFVWSSRFTRLPLQLYRFDDGWFVVDARGEAADLVGARVVAVAGMPVEELARHAEAIVTKDNEWNALSRLAPVLVTPEILRALGLPVEARGVTLGLERGGKPFETSLSGEPGGPHPRHELPAIGEAPWLRDRDRAWWSSVLEPERALYVQYNQVLASGEGGSLADFAATCLRTVEERDLRRVVLDLRSNGGGDNTTFGPLVATLCKDTRVNRRGRLYVLTSRHTFSAAGNFVTVVDRETEALLVGEPTGGAPNQYGDARAVPLPRHPEVIVRIVTRYHAFGGPGDERLTHEPDLRVPFSSADYFGGRDPVLARALAFEGG